MLVVLSKTYNGKEGLFVAGHPYEMSKNKLAMIQEDCAARKETNEYRVVPEGKPINRPSKKQQATPNNKQQTGGETK